MTSSYSVRFPDGANIKWSHIKQMLVDSSGLKRVVADRGAKAFRDNIFAPVVAGTYQSLLNELIPAAITNNKISGDVGWKAPLKLKMRGISSKYVKISGKTLTAPHAAWQPYTDKYAAHKRYKRRPMTFRLFSGKSFAKFGAKGSASEFAAGGGLNPNNIAIKGRSSGLIGIIPNRIGRITSVKDGSRNLLAANIKMSVRLIPATEGLGEFIVQGFTSGNLPSADLIDGPGKEYMLLNAFEGGSAGNSRKDGKPIRRPIIGPVVTAASRVLNSRLKRLNK